jgi:ABC-type Fe3+ transport system permease subunit
MDRGQGTATTAPPQSAMARVAGARAIRTWSATLALLGPSLLLIGCFFFYPLLITLYTSLTAPGEPSLTIRNYVGIFQSAEYLGVIGITVLLGIATTACSIAIAIPLALQLRKRPPGHEAIRVLILIPLVVLVLIGGLGLLIVLSDTGWAGKSIAVIFGQPIRINYTIAGLVISYTWLYAPYTILTTLAAIEGISQEVEEAARVVGASPMQVLLRVTLPLSLPGIKAGAILTFLLAFEAFGIPLIAGGNYRPLAVEVYTQAHVFNNHERGSALAVIMALSALAILAVPEIAGQLRTRFRLRSSRAKPA